MEPAFQTLRIRKEWETLKEVNPRFFMLLQQIFNKAWPTVPIITNLYRTQMEQDRIYKNSPKYQTSPWQSVHQSWRGCDVTVKNLKKKEVRELDTKVNLAWPYGKGDIKTLLFHNVGQGNHGHLQLRYYAPEEE